MEKLNVDKHRVECIISHLQNALDYLSKEQEKTERMANDIRISIEQTKFELETWNQIHKISKEQDKCD